MERFGETRKRKGKDESGTGDKKQSRSCRSEAVGFLREKLEQGREFRSEDFQGKKNEREAREKQHNPLMTKNKQMQAQQSQTIQALIQ